MYEFRLEEYSSTVRIYHFEDGPTGATVAIHVRSGKHVVAFLSLGEIDADSIATLLAGNESSTGC